MKNIITSVCKPLLICDSQLDKKFCRIYHKSYIYQYFLLNTKHRKTIVNQGVFFRSVWSFCYINSDREKVHLCCKEDTLVLELEKIRNQQLSFAENLPYLQFSSLYWILRLYLLCIVVKVFKLLLIVHV